MWTPFLSVAHSGVPRGGFWGGSTSHPPTPRNSEGPPKSWQTEPDCKNCYKLLNLVCHYPKMFGKKGSKILKLPPVHNCFTLAMINKLVVIINSLKVPKIKKILLNELKFLVPNYSCLRNPWLGGYRPQIPVLYPQLNLFTPHSEQNSWVRHWWHINSVMNEVFF